MNYDIKQISQMLADRTLSFCEYILPNGRKNGHEWVCGNVYGEQGNSLKVNLSGKAGTWKDFASDDKGGDLIDLIIAVRNCSKADAVREAKQYLGIKEEKIKFEPRQKEYKKPEKPKNLTKPNSKIYEYFYSRGISENVVNLLNIGMIKNAEKGDVILFPYLRDGELIFTKYRSLLNKKDMWTTKDAEPCLFGWQNIPDGLRTLIIVEGEIDVLSFLQAGYNAVSVPRGGGDGAKQDCWIDTDWERLQLFDEIILALDNDEQGKKASDYIAQRLGRHRCLSVDFGQYKDANDFLLAGCDFMELIANAKSCDPIELKPAKDFIEDVVEFFHGEDEANNGFSIPWGSDDIYNYHIRPSEVTVWAGINGHGKSQVIGHVASKTIKDGARWCIASMEFPAHKLLARMFRQIACTSKPSAELCRTKIADYVDRSLFLFNVQGRTKAEKILEVFEYAHRRYGCNQFLIDSLAKCGMGEDDYNAQKDFVEKCTEFAMQFNVHVHIVCHMRKGKDEQEKPDKMNIKGTGAITDMVDNVMLVWRNKAKEEKMQELKEYEHIKRGELHKQPCGSVVCQKQRNGEWEGFIKLWFDKSSMQYRDSFENTHKQLF